LTFGCQLLLNIKTILNIIKITYSSLGVAEKVAEPSTMVSFLGITIDTIKDTIKMETRLQKASKNMPHRD